MKVFATSRRNLKLLAIIDIFSNVSRRSIQKLTSELNCSEKTVRNYISMLKDEIRKNCLERSFTIEIKNLNVFFIIHHQYALNTLKVNLIHHSENFKYVNALILNNNTAEMMNELFLIQFDCILNCYYLKLKKGSLYGREEQIQKFIFDFMKSHLIDYHHAHSKSFIDYLKVKLNLSNTHSFDTLPFSIFFFRREQLQKIKELKRIQFFFRDNTSFYKFTEQMKAFQICFEFSFEEMKYLYLTLLKYESIREYYNMFQSSHQKSHLEPLIQSLVSSFTVSIEEMYDFHINLLLYGNRLNSVICQKTISNRVAFLAEKCRQDLKLKLPLVELKRHYQVLLENQPIKKQIKIGFTERINSKHIKYFMKLYGGIFDFMFYYLPVDIKVDILLATHEDSLECFQFYKQIYFEQLNSPMERQKVAQMLILIFQNKSL